ncbi:MAG: DNA polymerase III subunit beta [Alphaproteobacteria bacterium]
MKLTIERAALLRALAHVQSVVERRNTIPILSNLLMRGDKNQVSLAATDMDIEIVETVAAEVQRPGATTVPAHTLYDIVRKLRDGAQVQLETDSAKGILTLRSGRSTFTLSTLPAEDFPALSGGELPHRFAIAADALRRLVDRTRFAISTEETRYYLNGIYVHATKAGDLDVLRAVATDGHRLARVEMPLPEGAAGMPGVIVPRKTVNELRKLVDEVTDPIDIAVSDAKIRFTFAGATLTSKLIDGSFPEYERVIPTQNDKVMEVPRQPFFEAVDRVSTITSDKARAVKLQVDPKGLVLSATSPETGTAQEELEVAYTAAGIEIGFNARYLLDILQQIEGDDARFAMADAGSPTLVQDREDASALYVLMPMRV